MILLDGNDINNIPLKTLRENIAYVPQDNFLFSDTLRSNIAFGADDNMEDIERATRAACIHDNGLEAETLVGPAYKGRVSMTIL